MILIELPDDAAMVKVLRKWIERHYSEYNDAEAWGSRAEADAYEHFVEKVQIALEPEQREVRERAVAPTRCTACGCWFTVHSHVEVRAANGDWNCPHCDQAVKAR